MKEGGGRLPLLLLTFLALLLASRLLPSERGAPAFSLHAPPAHQVALDGSWSRPGIHQFFDDLAGECVTVLTDPECAYLNSLESQMIDGMVLRFDLPIQRRWLTAGQRVALQIPLHPDRMSVEDWDFLPGVGPGLAAAIEADRQLSGDFGSVSSLRRVKGVGPKRIASWREFFSDQSTRRN